VTAVLFAWQGGALFARGTWIPVTVPMLALVLGYVGDLAWKYFVEGREKRQVKKLFSRYVSKDVYDQLVANPSLAALGGARRHMTVLFSDIRGFTDDVGKGHARGRRCPAEPAIHADGGRGIQSPRNGR
jgi:adenylate cyclase